MGDNVRGSTVVRTRPGERPGAHPPSQLHWDCQQAHNAVRDAQLEQLKRAHNPVILSLYLQDGSSRTAHLPAHQGTELCAHPYAGCPHGSVPARGFTKGQCLSICTRKHMPHNKSLCENSSDSLSGHAVMCVITWYITWS